MNTKYSIIVEETNYEGLARICAELTRQGICYKATLHGGEWEIYMSGGY